MRLSCNRMTRRTSLVPLGAGILLAVLTMACASGDGAGADTKPRGNGDDDPGEVDLICVRDGLVLVMEIKSTFLRCSQKDAWLHGVTTLRKAGLQLRRKVQAVQNALTTNTDLASMLGIETEAMPLPILGWIVDTSIEHDHERFNGFLKVSLEEVLIALRDDRHLLNDPE